MDDKFTKQMQDWLALDADKRNIEEGAALLLRINRNRILYQNILRRPERMASKLEYELKKHLRIRLDGKTIREVVLMERTVIPAVDKTLSEPAPDSADLKSDKSGVATPFRGRRADHDSLPEEVKKLYEDNGTIFRKLRQTRETLRSMMNAEPCDRYEYCKLLDELDRTYHANWEAYDHYDNSQAAAAATEEAAPAATEEAAVASTEEAPATSSPAVDSVETVETVETVEAKPAAKKASKKKAAK